VLLEAKTKPGYSAIAEACRRRAGRSRKSNEELFRILEGFPDLAHDDEVDACSGASEMLNSHMKAFGIYEATRRQAEQLRAQQCPKPQPAQTLPGPGSMEWFAAQNKSS
jgi:hypothetical protein